jgi:hypothetical protein
VPKRHGTFTGARNGDSGRVGIESREQEGTVVRIDVADRDRAKELVRVLMTEIGAEPVSLDWRTGTICVSSRDEDELTETLQAVDAWLRDTDVAVITLTHGVRSFTMRKAAVA